MRHRCFARSRRSRSLPHVASRLPLATHMHRGTSEHVPVRLDTSDHSVGAGTPRAPTGNGHESSAGIGGRASGHPGTITATRSGPEGCSSGGGPFYRRSELGDHEAPRIRGVLSRSQRSWAYPRSPAGPECAHAPEKLSDASKLRVKCKSLTPSGNPNPPNPIWFKPRHPGRCNRKKDVCTD